jgi:hypothetical protein
MTGAVRHRKGNSIVSKVQMILLVAAAAAAAPALAANQGSTAISGSLAQTCSVTAPANQTFDPASTASQSVGSPSYQCNFIGNASLRFWSQNGGAVIAPAGPGNGNLAQSRPFTFSFDGTSLGQLGNSAGAALPVSRPISVANVQQTGPASIQLASPAMIAGTYSDVLFVSIAP